MAEIANMGCVVDKAEGADWADVAEMTLRKRMNALFYFDRLVHKQAPAESRILTNELYLQIRSIAL